MHFCANQSVELKVETLHNMETAVIDVIAQGGATGVFAVFAWWLVKEQRKERENTTSVWMTYLKERNGKTEKFMETHTQALEKMRETLDNHTLYGDKRRTR